MIYFVGVLVTIVGMLIADNAVSAIVMLAGLSLEIADFYRVTKRRAARDRPPE